MQKCNRTNAQELRANTLEMKGKISHSKEGKHVKNIKMRIVGLKNTMTKIKYSLAGLSSRSEMRKESLRQLENKS